jgi:hypothetical protein
LENQNHRAISHEFDKLHKLPDVFFPNKDLTGKNFSITINISNEKFTIRELASYLNLIERIFGRMFPSGLKSYSQQPNEHLEIFEIRSGSWEIKVVEFISENSQLIPIFAYYLILKALPLFLRNISSAYYNYEEGRLVRAKRKFMEEKFKEAKSEEGQKLLKEISAEKEFIEIDESVGQIEKDGAESDDKNEKINLIKNEIKKEIKSLSYNEDEIHRLAEIIKQILDHDKPLQGKALKFSEDYVNDVNYEIKDDAQIEKILDNLKKIKS